MLFLNVMVAPEETPASMPVIKAAELAGEAIERLWMKLPSMIGVPEEGPLK